MTDEYDPRRVKRSELLYKNDNMRHYSPPAVTALGSGVSVAAGASGALMVSLAGAGTSAASSSASASSSPSASASSSSSSGSSSSSSSAASPLGTSSPEASVVLRFFTGGSTVSKESAWSYSRWGSCP